MEIINGYQLVGELVNDKSGYAKWGFARKDGIDFFIKEFLSPIYPLDGTAISAEQIIRKRKICAEFETEKKAFYDRLNQCFTGNVVTVADFFRWGSRYYMVTEKIDATPIDPKTIAGFDIAQKVLLVKIILYGMNILHQHGIVHGDIKPDNILFKRTAKGVYTAKLIDFDSSFTEDNAPTDEDFQGDMVYLAPESFLFIAEEITQLSTKIDVFALGILFHQYFSGELPGFDTEQYDYAFEAVLDDGGLTIDNKIPRFMRDIIVRMLDKDPEKRPTVNDVFMEIQNYIAAVGYVDRDIVLPNRTGIDDKHKSSLIIRMGNSKTDGTVAPSAPTRKTEDIAAKKIGATDENTEKNLFFYNAGEL